jgi:hypothetical protein
MKDFLYNFLEVNLQKPCNTHRHEYMEKLLNNIIKKKLVERAKVGHGSL